MATARVRTHWAIAADRDRGWCRSPHVASHNNSSLTKQHFAAKRLRAPSTPSCFPNSGVVVAASGAEAEQPETAASAIENRSSDNNVLVFAQHDDPSLAESCVHVMAQALQDDPSTSYFCWPNSSKQFYTAAVFDSLCSYPRDQQIYSLRQGGCSALCYQFPRHQATSPWQLRLPYVLKSLLCVRLDRLLVGFKSAEALSACKDRFLQLQGAFLYISVIATLPELQGQGRGSKLLSFITAAADRQSMWCYVEASSERNRRLYSRHGFEDWASVQLTRTVPVTYLMMRPPS